MFCKNCDKEIAVGDSYFKYSECPFCSSDCVTDYMIYNGRLAIKTDMEESEDD